MKSIHPPHISAPWRRFPLRNQHAGVTPEHPALFNLDCIEGAHRHLKNDSTDLILTDPPYGIDGTGLERLYSRSPDRIEEGYVDVHRTEYAHFTRRWIAQAERILRPGGSIYIVSGYTHLLEILQALRDSSLEEINHIIWKYSFGLHTTRKYVSSHLHILYYSKPGGTPTFNRNARFSEKDQDADGHSHLYRDLEDVWTLPREYKPGRSRNQNELPWGLLAKIIQYSSHPGDIVADLFLGSFSTAKVARAMNRSIVGFEVNPSHFEKKRLEVEQIEPGSLLKDLPRGHDDAPRRRRKRWTDEELDRLVTRFLEIRSGGRNKGEAIHSLTDEFERGRFAIRNALKRRGL
ncbi:MAG: site-specific DNA-methyltransferase [Planctomycetota bacterium]|nr:site-specific DNA-methyltransferase [Planctomycetota bacterium]